MFSMITFRILANIINVCFWCAVSRIKFASKRFYFGVFPATMRAENLIMNARISHNFNCFFCLVSEELARIQESIFICVNAFVNRCIRILIIIFLFQLAINPTHKIAG